MQPAALPEAAGGALPAAVVHPARGLLPLQGPCRGLVPPEFRPALAVAVRRAGLAVEALMAAGPRRQALGDVLCVGGGAALAWTAVGVRGGTHTPKVSTSGPPEGFDDLL